MTVTVHRQFGPGEYGTDIIENVIPFPTLVASTTTTVNLGYAYRTSVFKQAFAAQFSGGTYGGTATVTIQKYSGGAATALTAAQDVTTTGIPIRVTKLIPALTTLTDSQKTLIPGDVLEAVFTLSSTVSTQPGGGAIGAETFLVK